MQMERHPIKLFPKMNHRKRRGGIYFLFSLPFIVFFIAFAYVPLFGWIYAFFDYQIGQRFLDPTQMVFMGVQNFIKMFIQRDEVLRVLRNTFALSGIGILCSPVPVIFAILMNELGSRKFKRFVQTTTTLPNFISWIIVFSLIYSIFSGTGLMNSILESLGIATDPTGALGNDTHAWLVQTLIGLWKNTGWGCIIYMATISGADAELIDAVHVDGGGRFRTIWHVILPTLIPTYLVLLLLGISNALKNGFDQYFMFYNPLVADKIEVLDYYVYKIGFLVNDYSYSIALCMTQTVLSVLLLFFVNNLAKKTRGESLI